MQRLTSIFICLCFICETWNFTLTEAKSANSTIFTEGLNTKELALLFSQSISVAVMNSLSTNQAKCFNETIPFNDFYVIKEAFKMKKSGISLVSLPRMIASLWLTRAALALPVKGDVVETGETF